MSVKELYQTMSVEGKMLVLNALGQMQGSRFLHKYAPSNLQPERQLKMKEYFLDLTGSPEPLDMRYQQVWQLLDMLWGDLFPTDGDPFVCLLKEPNENTGQLATYGSPLDLVMACSDYVFQHGSPYLIEDAPWFWDPLLGDDLGEYFLMSLVTYPWLGTDVYGWDGPDGDVNPLLYPDLKELYAYEPERHTDVLNQEYRGQDATFLLFDTGLKETGLTVEMIAGDTPSVTILWDQLEEDITFPQVIELFHVIGALMNGVGTSVLKRYWVNLGGDEYEVGGVVTANVSVELQRLVVYTENVDIPLDADRQDEIEQRGASFTQAHSTTSRTMEIAIFEFQTGFKAMGATITDYYTFWKDLEPIQLQPGQTFGFLFRIPVGEEALLKEIQNMYGVQYRIGDTQKTFAF